VRVLAVSGSLRSGSLNSELLRLAAGQAPEGVELVGWYGLADLPHYDADRETPEPAAVAALREALESADAVLVATPEYNGSVPGALKNAIDWASRPEPLLGALWSKPVAVISASTGSFGAVWAQTELNKVLRTAGARVVETGLAVAKADRRLEDPDEELLGDLRQVLELLVGEAVPAAATAPPLRPVRVEASRAAA
jgi:chromate reductase